MVNLGFMLYMDPSKHLCKDASQRIINEAKSADCIGTGNGKKFQLVAGTPFLYIGGRRYPTKACLQSHLFARQRKRC
jgi:hypothetical protein